MSDRRRHGMNRIGKGENSKSQTMLDGCFRTADQAGRARFCKFLATSLYNYRDPQNSLG